jgi:hypothetical protein
LSLAARGQWELAALLFVLGNLGFLGANVFYTKSCSEHQEHEDWIDERRMIREKQNPAVVLGRQLLQPTM